MISVIIEFMKTIVVANQKGGSGKSTLTVHLAAAAEHAQDGPVLLTDADPQGTAADWFNQRKAAGIHVPRYANVSTSGMQAARQAFKAAGARYLFIDTAPSVGQANADLFKLADLILVPLNPTPADLRALVKAIPLLKASDKPFLFVLSRVRANLKNNNGTALALHSLGLVLDSRMHERVIYAEAFGHGCTTLEIEPNGVASRELLALWGEVKSRIHELQKEQL